MLDATVAINEYHSGNQYDTLRSPRRPIEDMEGPDAGRTRDDNLNWTNACSGPKAPCRRWQACQASELVGYFEIAKILYFFLPSGASKTTPSPL